MFLLLSKTRICSSFFSVVTAQYNHPLLPRFFTSPSTETPIFMAADYLASSFGFSSDKAARVSKSIARLKSPDKPDSVRSFLNEQGFTEDDIKKLIIGRPDILCSSPEKTLDPNLRTLRDMGLSTSALKQIIISNPTTLLRHSAVSRITFWMDFLGGNEALLVKTFTRNRGLINYDISQAVTPKISLLQSHGLSTQEIGRIISMVDRFIIRDITVMEDLLKRTKELGFQPGSGMFPSGLKAMSGVSREGLQKKMDLLMSFGWSEDEFFSAVKNAPRIVTLKEENLCTKMDFLLEEARCVPSYIASHPMLLTCSLEKRLRPRNNVLHLLETRGLCKKHRVLYNAICICNSDFVEKYILPHKEIIPELNEAFALLCASGS